MNYTPIDFFRNLKKEGAVSAFEKDWNNTGISAKLALGTTALGLGMIAWSAAFNYAHIVTHISDEKMACEVAKTSTYNAVREMEFNYGAKLVYPLIIGFAYGADLGAEKYAQRNCK